jgi:RNA polymerase sigma-70 factor (ECF subfamily)
MEEDFELVTRSLRNETDAFGRLVDKYQKPIYNLGMRMFGNSDDAEDLTQNVFIKSWERLDSYDNKYKFFSWLYRIAVNESLNYSNREKIKERLNGEEHYTLGGSIEKDYEKYEQSRKIHEALLEIDLNYRVVIVLKHYMELSYLEIAELIQIPEKTVKSRLFSARQLLKNSLVRKGILNNE